MNDKVVNANNSKKFVKRGRRLRRQEKLWKEEDQK